LRVPQSPADRLPGLAARASRRGGAALERPAAAAARRLSHERLAVSRRAAGSRRAADDGALRARADADGGGGGDPEIRSRGGEFLHHEHAGGVRRRGGTVGAVATGPRGSRRPLALRPSRPLAASRRRCAGKTAQVTPQLAKIPLDRVNLAIERPPFSRLLHTG